MPRDRKYPPGGVAYGKDQWAKMFDLTKKVVVYWPSAPGSVTVVGYYNTVSAANSAALAAVSASGAYPHVEVNWWHSDFTFLTVGAVAHRDERADMPAWYDADPAY